MAAGLLGAGALGYLGGRISAGGARPTVQGHAPEAGTTKPAEAPADRGGQGPALASLGDRYALYADGEGRLVLLRRTEATNLEIAAVYALRDDRKRHLAAGAERRAPHGLYLDDLAQEDAAALEAAKAAFLAETSSGAVDPGAWARAEAAARAVLEAGDATSLLAALADASYAARRSAAFVLGEAGFQESIPVLEEVAKGEREGDGPARADALLRKLRGGGP